MKILIIFGILLVEYLQLSESIDCSLDPKNTEARLRKKILCSYDKDLRPETSSKNGTLVKVRIFLKSFDYSEYSNKVYFNTWMGMRWTDNQLKWDPAEYDGISSLTVQSEEIWMPDLAIYNSRYKTAEAKPGETPIDTTQFDEACSSSHCALSSSGSVSCIPPCEHSGVCKGDFINWPYDIQNCTLHFGSWMHKGSEITYKAEKLHIDNEALLNNEWKLLSINFKNIPGNYSCCPNETYPSIRINMVMERIAVSETGYIFTPAIILGSINLVSLWLSPSCTERIILNVVSLFSHFTYIQQFYWVIPKNGSTAPKSLTYFRDSVIIATILLLQTVALRGLLLCKSATPAWIKSTTDSLRGNKIGQLMFTNPYLIDRGVPLTNEDATNLVEEQQTEGNNPNSNSKTGETTASVWMIAVRTLDTLMFLALLITYIVLLFGWMPSDHYKPSEAIKADIIETSE